MVILPYEDVCVISKHGYDYFFFYSSDLQSFEVGVFPYLTGEWFDHQVEEGTQ